LQGIGIGWGNRAFEENRKQDEGQHHRDDGKEFSVAFKIEEEEDENDGRETQAVRAISVVPYLETDKIEFDPHAGTDEDKKKGIFFQDAEEDNTGHAGDAYILKVDPEDTALKVGT